MNMGLPLKNFVEIIASPPKNSIFSFCNLHLGNFMVPEPWRGGGGLGCGYKMQQPLSHSKIIPRGRKFKNGLDPGLWTLDPGLQTHPLPPSESYRYQGQWHGQIQTVLHPCHRKRNRPSNLLGKKKKR